MLLIIGKELYGKDWAKISEMLPCRYVMSNCVLTFYYLCFAELQYSCTADGTRF